MQRKRPPSPINHRVHRRTAPSPAEPRVRVPGALDEEQIVSHMQDARCEMQIAAYQAGVTVPTLTTPRYSSSVES